MNFSLLLNFTRQDLIDRYSGSILGGLWSFIMPLIHILIFVLIFSKIMGAKLEVFGADFAAYGYSIYLVSGILVWNAFASVIMRTTNLFRDKAGLISKVNIKLAWLPLFIILSESIIFIISMVFFLIFLWLIEYPLSYYWFYIPVFYLLQLILAYGIGFFCATLSTFIKDIREIVNVFLQLWFWFTPIVYVVQILPEELQFWFQLNPMYQLIGVYRSLIIYQQMPDLNPIMILAMIALMILLLSLITFRKLEKDLRDII